MIEIIKKLLGKEYRPLNKIEISRKNLLSNYRYLSSINRKVKIAPVLKSNAYGHGISEVGKTLDSLHCPFFCVDSIFEAYQLLRAGIKTKILIMGYIDPENLKVKRLPFSYSVWDLGVAQALNKHQPGCEVHIFTDTGMGREGVRIDQLEEFISEIKKLNNIKIVGLMSHLANSEEGKNEQDKLQTKNFQKAIRICREIGLRLKYTHLSNSAGHLKNLNNNCNLSRVGIALYGISPLGENPKLKPALKFSTKIVQIKNLKKGDKVGYGGTYTAKKDITVGVLPAGYNDGVDRRLSNKGIVTYSGINCPVIGMISMNITMIDLSDVLYPKIGDSIVIYSDNKGDPNSIKEVARLYQTIPYDILVNPVPATRREAV